MNTPNKRDYSALLFFWLSIFNRLLNKFPNKIERSEVNPTIKYSTQKPQSTLFNREHTSENKNTQG